jgi:ferredoxin
MITVDHDKCIGTGLCVLIGPDVFDQDDDLGTVVLRDPDPHGPGLAVARLAARACPRHAIAVASDSRQSDKAQR